MNWTNVKLIFLREVRDQLRDRRTLFMVAVLPLLLYPALGLGMLQMQLLFTEQARTVVVLGADDLPDPPLVENARFRPEYFEAPSDADKLHVVTKTAGDEVDNGNRSEEEGGGDILRAARKLRPNVEDIVNLQDAAEQARESGDVSEAEALEDRVTALKAQISEAMSAAGIQVLIVVPEGLKQHIDMINQQLLEGDLAGVENPPRLQIVRNSADEKSLIAYARVKEAVQSWEEQVLLERLKSAALPESFPEPIKPDQIDLAQEQQLAANIWSKLFPALLVIMSVTGAFYPAVDLGAGEKERGTMETLLISPAKRTEIVIGKFLTVLLFSMGTALLNLASMGFTGKHMLSMGADEFSKFGSAVFPPVSSLVWVVVLAIPLAALFSSLSLGLAMFARSSKEGQYYLTPLLMVTMGLTVFCLSPAVEITPFYSVLPVMGPALLLKALLLSSSDATSLYWYAVPVLVTSLGYCALGLWWAIEQFRREDILFREAEQFELRLWIKHLLRDKEPTPGFSEAVFCFVLIMLLQFAAMRVMGQATMGLSEDQLPVRMMQLLLIQQLAIIATPALMMGVMLTTSVRKTFRLNWPSLKYLGVAFVLAPLLHPPTAELSAYLGEYFFPQLPESAQSALAPMLDRQQAWWLVFLTFSIVPGICEEIAFRGFLLSGFSRRGRTGMAVILSSIAFGAMHMFPQQVFNAALLGLVLGLLVVRSNSLLPAVVFHMLYNGMEVLRNRVQPDVWTMPPVQWLVTVESMDQQTTVRYGWPLLTFCVIVAGMLIVWLVRQGSSPPQRSAETTHDAPHVSAAASA